MEEAKFFFAVIFVALASAGVIAQPPVPVEPFIHVMMDNIKSKVKRIFHFQ